MENPQWKKFIEERLLMYTFANDKWVLQFAKMCADSEQEPWENHHLYSFLNNLLCAAGSCLQMTLWVEMVPPLTSFWEKKRGILTTGCSTVLTVSTQSQDFIVRINKSSCPVYFPSKLDRRTPPVSVYLGSFFYTSSKPSRSVTEKHLTLKNHPEFGPVHKSSPGVSDSRLQGLPLSFLSLIKRTSKSGDLK